MPEDLSPMMSTEAPSLHQSEVVAPQPSAVAAKPPRVSTGKKSAAESWADWRASGSAASADLFCQSVSSWMEGVSAQLVRPLWPVGGVRPTSAEVQVRLRKGLALVVADEPNYVKGLDAARRHVAGEMNTLRTRALAAR